MALESGSWSTQTRANGFNVVGLEVEVKGQGGAH